MSRPFNPKAKDLSGLMVVDSQEVWTTDKKGDPRLRTDIDIYGRVDKGSSAIVSVTNLKGNNHRFVEDFSALPKNIKNDLTNVFRNHKGRTGYLVRRDTFTQNLNPIGSSAKKAGKTRSATSAKSKSAKTKPGKGGRF